MAKKKKTRRRAKTTIPITIAGPVIAELAGEPFARLRSGDVSGAMNRVVADYTGYDIRGKVWRAEYLKGGAAPVVIGAIAHKVANRLGVNRVIARAGIPLLRI